MICNFKQKYYIYSLCLVEEQVDDVVLTLGMVEEDKQTPVDQPSSLLQLQQILTFL